MTILSILLIIILVFAITYITLFYFKEEKIYKLEKQALNAKRRAVTHFRKLIKIEDILRKAEEEKTPAVIVLDKIKEVIVGQNK